MRIIVCMKYDMKNKLILNFIKDKHFFNKETSKLFSNTFFTNLIEKVKL